MSLSFLEWGLFLIVFVVIPAVFLLCIPTSDNIEQIKEDLIGELEMAYFERQRDALEGNVRIEKRDSTWHWVKSPWDSGREPIFDPSKDAPVLASPVEEE